MKTKEIFLIAFGFLFLAACGLPAAAVMTAPTENSPVLIDEQEEAGVEVPPQPAASRLIPVEHVEVQVGIGSPIPVNILVSGTWPDLCAQLAEVQQRIEDFTITVTLTATPEVANCPPDYVGLYFGFTLPLNPVQLPVGTYSVVVNGVSTSFLWDPAQLKPVENPMPVPLSFESLTYRNETAGFEFDYPISWFLNDLGQVGTRGSTVQLTSWISAPDQPTQEPPTGSSRMDVTLYAWDPRNELDAYISTRKQAWEASGMSILSEEEWALAENYRAVLFQVLTADQNQTALFLLTTMGDQYLVFSGTGDLSLLNEIFHTVRLTDLTKR